MKFIATLIIFFLLSNIVIAQSDSTWKFKRKNNVNIEIFGPTLYSFNYERTLLNFRRFKTGISLGASYFNYDNQTPYSKYSIPASISTLIALDKSDYFEIGAGLLYYKKVKDEYHSFLIDDYQKSPKIIASVPYLIVGFRYQNPSRRSIVKIGFNPMITKTELSIMPPVGSGYSIIPFPYFSYGINF